MARKKLKNTFEYFIHLITGSLNNTHNTNLFFINTLIKYGALARNHTQINLNSYLMYLYFITLQDYTKWPLLILYRNKLYIYLHIVFLCEPVLIICVFLYIFFYLFCLFVLFLYFQVIQRRFLLSHIFLQHNQRTFHTKIIVPYNNKL